jgi:hypothetical protein
MYATPQESTMLLFDDSKKLEKALGEEAAAVLAHVFERADDQWRHELATKAGLLATKTELQADLAATENRILRWMVGGFLAQTALLVALMALQR